MRTATPGSSQRPDQHPDRLDEQPDRPGERSDGRPGTRPGTGGRSARLMAVVRVPVLVWLLQRLLLEGLGTIVVAVAGVPKFSRPGPFGTFFNWDSGWFACVARSGYFGPACAGGGTVERFAFFPLYPLAGRGIGWLAAGGHPGEAQLTFGLWLAAAVGSLVAATALHALVARQHGARTAFRATVLFLFGPYAVFLVASYSEALYLAAAVLAWYLCTRRHYLATGLVGVVATLTRASGLFLVPALLVLCLTQSLAELTPEQRARPGRFAARVVGRLVLVGVSGLGVLGYFVWLAVRTGDPMAWFHAQSTGWNRRTRWPWETLVNQGIHVLRERRWDWQIQAGLECLFAVGLVIAVVLFLRRREWAYATLVGLTAISLMTSNSYLSLARNTLTLFPLVILLAGLTARRRWFVVAVVAGAVLLVFNTIQFALGNWAD